MSSMVTKPNRGVLKKYFPEIGTFREGQEAAIDRVVAGHNTLCLMPTGAGKSLVYQVAGIRRGGTTLVLSPLIALMTQQSERLSERPGVTALSLSDLSGARLYDRLRAFDFGQGPNFVFTSPERLSFDGFLEFALRRGRKDIGLIVVDEAHCVSQWGHTFRPAYKAIPRCLDELFGPQAWPPILCLTATLNPRDLQEISTDFRIQDAGVIRTAALLRNNLHLSCEHHADEKAKKARLAQLLEKHSSDKCIVYVHRKESEYGTERLAAHFAAQGLSCGYFDADRKDAEKRDVLDGFESGTTKIVFATSAFGMGIDIPDVRVVIHYLLPESIEQYYQEVGRAGRDGKPAYGYLLFSETNKKVRKQLIKSSMVTREQIETMFTTKLALRDNEVVRTIDPFSDIVEEKGERSAWYALQLAGVVNVIAKGPLNIRCFAPSSAGTAGLLEAYLAAAAPAGLTKTVARKRGIAVQQVVADLWQFYANGAAKLLSSPSHGQYFTTPRSPPTHVLDAIEADLKAKLDARLKGFEALVEMVEAGGDPTERVCQHLGLAGASS